MATIVLVHGILGVGAELFPGIPTPLDYFNGVRAHLDQSGIGVLAPTVKPLQSIEDRGDQLAKQLENLPEDRVDIIAHSMGGLDARYVLHRYPCLASRITSLTTIGTPHRGSAVADMVHDITGRLDQFSPALLKKQFGAIADLTTAQAAQFNAATPDADGVHYMNIAGVADASAQQILLQFAAHIGNLGGLNDGVVLRTSALYDHHEHLPDWPVDHFGEIGWAKWNGGIALDTSVFYPPGHLQRYNELLKRIWSIPARKQPGAG